MVDAYIYNCIQYTLLFVFDVYVLISDMISYLITLLTQYWLFPVVLKVLKLWFSRCLQSWDILEWVLDPAFSWFHSILSKLLFDVVLILKHFTLSLSSILSIWTNEYIFIKYWSRFVCECLLFKWVEVCNDTTCLSQCLGQHFGSYILFNDADNTFFLCLVTVFPSI